MRAEDTARSLRAIGRPALAAIVDADGETPLLEYAARLHAHAPPVPLEPALAAAFRDELTRLGHPAITVSAAMADLEERRVLQTATHVTASEGPIFLAMHRMATIGLDPSLPYLVGACSGIPFSNDAHPGCLNLGRRYPLSAVLEPGSPAHRARARARAAAEQKAPSDQRISMIPWAMRSSRSAPRGTACADRIASNRSRPLRCSTGSAKESSAPGSTSSSRPSRSRMAFAAWAGSRGQPRPLPRPPPRRATTEKPRRRAPEPRVHRSRGTPSPSRRPRAFGLLELLLFT